MAYFLLNTLTRLLRTDTFRHSFLSEELRMKAEQMLKLKHDLSHVASAEKSGKKGARQAS